MNKEFHDYAVGRINSMSTEELRQGLRDAGILSNNLNQGASIEARILQVLLKNTSLSRNRAARLADVIVTLVGTDRRTPAAQVGAGELPKKMSWLDAPHDIQNDHANAWAKGWNACRAAIEADRAQLAAPASAQPADEMTADEARAALKAMPLDQAVSMVRGAQPDQRDSAATKQAEGANQGAEGEKND